MTNNETVHNGTMLSDTLTRVTDYLSDFFDRKYNSDVNHKLYENIRDIDWLSPIDHSDAIAALVYITRATNEYNAVTMTPHFKLSKHNRINISKSYDVFHNISIACIDPLTDIDSVTLYVQIILPKLSILKDIQPFDAAKYFSKADCTFNNIWFDKSKYDTHYIPIKKIINPSSKCVQFYKHPIFLITDPNIAFSIEVQYKTRIGAPNIHAFEPSCNIVGLKSTVMDMDIRRKIALTDELPLFY